MIIFDKRDSVKNIINLHFLPAKYNVLFYYIIRETIIISTNNVYCNLIKYAKIKVFIINLIISL